MKKINYIICALFAILIGINSVYAAGNVSVASTVIAKPGDTKSISITITDLMTKMDITSSDPSIVEVLTPAVDLKTDGTGSVTGEIRIKALQLGTATITISSSDSAEFSSGEEYDFPTKTVTINITEDVPTSPGGGGSSSEPTDPSNNSGSNGSSESSGSSGSNSTNNNGSTNSSSSSKKDDHVNNPKTGVEDYIIPGLIILIVGCSIYFAVKNKTLFKRF